MLVSCASRAKEFPRFASHVDPEAATTRFWAFGHGLAMLVLTGVLARGTLDDHVPPTATALFVAVGDKEESCRRSVRAGWRSIRVTQRDEALPDESRVRARRR